MLRSEPLADLSERQWQRQVCQLAETLGWKRPYHVYDSRRSEPGWPDLCLVRDRVVFLELKREDGRLTVAQAEWLDALYRAGAEVYVARPRDLDALGKALNVRRSAAAITLMLETRHEVVATLGKAA